MKKAEYRILEWFGTLNPIHSLPPHPWIWTLPGTDQPQFPCFKSGFTNLHLQHLLEPLHDDQGGFLDSRITILGTVFHYFHQGFIGRTPQVILVSIRSATEGGRFFFIFNFSKPITAPIECCDKQEPLEKPWNKRNLWCHFWHISF